MAILMSPSATRLLSLAMIVVGGALTLAVGNIAMCMNSNYATATGAGSLLMVAAGLGYIAESVRSLAAEQMRGQTTNHID
jgi:hypothetical protein